MSDLSAEHDDEVEASRAPLLEHLLELRKRIIISLVAVVIAFVVCFIFARPIYNVLLMPFEDAARTVAARKDIPFEQLRLIYTAPLEFFFVKIKVALFGAIILAFP